MDSNSIPLTHISLWMTVLGMIITIAAMTATAAWIGVRLAIKPLRAEIDAIKEARDKRGVEIRELQDKINPIDSSFRFITRKECSAEHASTLSMLTDIKSAIVDMDRRHETRIARIDTRWETNLNLIYQLAGRVGITESEIEASTDREKKKGGVI